MLKLTNYIAILVLIINVSACATQTSMSESVQRDYQEFVESSSTTELTVPEEVTNALLESPLSDTQENTLVSTIEQRFDVSVQKVPAKTFFVGLVSQAGVNVVAHPEIEGVISLNLKDVAVEDVLSVVRDVYGYEYQFKNGIYTIYPRKLRTEIFHINYPDFKRVGVTDTSVLIGNINSNNGSQNGRRGRGGGGGGQNEDSVNLIGQAGGESENRSSQGGGFSPGSRVQTLNATNFWSLLQDSLSSMVGGDVDGRFVMTNPMAGIVVVRALPVEISTVREFLEKSELSVQRQVILETKILEVSLNDQHATGINWSAVSGALSLSNVISGVGDLDDVLFNGENTSEVLFGASLQVNDITKLINLLDQQGEVSVLSSPRISTVNNQKAVIRVGSDEFFVTGISNSTTASASTVTNTPEVELSSFFSGISLDVTPQIADDGDVILHVHPIVSNVQDQLKEIQVGDDNFSLPLALRDIRESDSIVKAASGQVVVLGGLMQESSSGVDTRRSKLGGVPILNVFFKHEAKSLRKTELVILMRPIVLNEESIDAEVRRGKNRFDSFGRD